MDVILKEGMLYLQEVKFVKKTWRKVWVLLLKSSSMSVGRLEFYTVLVDQKKVGMPKPPEKKVVCLSDCLSITPAPKKSCPPGCTAFHLKTPQCNYTLASTASQEWQNALCLLAFQKDPGETDKGGFKRGNDLTMEDNDLYISWKTDLSLPRNQYQVTVRSTEASRRCQLAGEYLVSPEEHAVLLLAVSTGHIIYRWPYILIRKFGQFEGGFSIEAGHRCESGEGVFIFLSRHSPQIFQNILKQCSVARRSSSQPLSYHTDQSPVDDPITTNQFAGPPVSSLAKVSADTEEDSGIHYSTINTSRPNARQLSYDKPYFSNRKEALREAEEEEDDEDDEELCHYLEVANLNNPMEDNLYYNLKRAPRPIITQDLLKPKTDNSECLYADVKIIDSTLHPQLEPVAPPLPPPDPPLPPSTRPQSVLYSLPKARPQHQQPANNCVQPVHNAQAWAVKEMEEAISSSLSAPPTEAPGSFKHRLAEIISKDLAKFQPPLLSGAGSPTFSQ